MKTMTLKQIIATRPEVAKLVNYRYPRNKAERRGCETEKAKRDHMRWMLAKKLINETPTREKIEFSTTWITKPGLEELGK